MKDLLLLIQLLMLCACQSQRVISEQKAGDANLSLQDYCSQFPCRGETEIVLRSKVGDFKQSMSFFWPAVQKGAISILPGETLFVEADLANGTLENLNQVVENENPKKTLVLAFSQIENSYAVLLSLKNPFDVRLKFNVEIMDFKGGLHKISSCPIGPRSSLVETWPQPFIQLFLINPRVVGDEESGECVY